jgi:RimJ/RimL family protein N-acetyltransferase
MSVHLNEVNKLIPRLVHTSDLLSLDPLTVDDIWLALMWRNDPQVCKWFKYDKQITGDEHRNFYNDYVQTPNDQMWMLNWAGDRFGTVALVDIDMSLGCAEYGRLINYDRTVAGRGIMQDVHKIVLAYAFKFLQLEYLYSYVKATNTRSLNSLHRAGFDVVDNRGETLKLWCWNPDLGQRIGMTI